MSKGDKKRPTSITSEENDLRWALAEGIISFAGFRKRYMELKKLGKIKRSGQIIYE